MSTDTEAKVRSALTALVAEMGYTRAAAHLGVSASHLRLIAKAGSDLGTTVPRALGFRIERRYVRVRP